MALRVATHRHDDSGCLVVDVAAVGVWGWEQQASAADGSTWQQDSTERQHCRAGRAGAGAEQQHVAFATFSGAQRHCPGGHV
jgi:hypothetical protein